MASPQQILIGVESQISDRLGTSVTRDDSLLGQPIQKLRQDLAKAQLSLHALKRQVDRQREYTGYQKLNVVYQAGRTATLTSPSSGTQQTLNLVTSLVYAAEDIRSSKDFKAKTEATIEQLLQLSTARFDTSVAGDFPTTLASKLWIDNDQARKVWNDGVRDRNNELQKLQHRIAGELRILIYATPTRKLAGAVFSYLNNDSVVQSVQPRPTPAGLRDDFGHTNSYYDQQDIDNKVDGLANSTVAFRRQERDLERQIINTSAVLGAREEILDRMSSEHRYVDAIAVLETDRSQPHLRADAVEVTLRYQASRQIDDASQSFGVPLEDILGSNQYQAINKFAADLERGTPGQQMQQGGTSIGF